MQKRLWLRYRPRARTRIPLQRMATLRPECLHTWPIPTVCRNHRTVWDRLSPVAHCRLIKEAPRSLAWPRRGSKWIKLSDGHFTEWRKWPNSTGRVVQSIEEEGIWMWDQAKDAKGMCKTTLSKQRTSRNTETGSFDTSKVPSLYTKIFAQISIRVCSPCFI